MSEKTAHLLLHTTTSPTSPGQQAAGTGAAQPPAADAQQAAEPAGAPLGLRQNGAAAAAAGGGGAGSGAARMRTAAGREGVCGMRERQQEGATAAMGGWAGAVQRVGCGALQRHWAANQVHWLATVQEGVWLLVYMGNTSAGLLAKLHVKPLACTLERARRWQRQRATGPGCPCPAPFPPPVWSEGKSSETTGGSWVQSRACMFHTRCHQLMRPSWQSKRGPPGMLALRALRSRLRVTWLSCSPQHSFPTSEMKGREDGFRSSCLNSSCCRCRSRRRRPSTNATSAAAMATAATPPTTPPTMAPTLVPPPLSLPPLLLPLGSPPAGATPGGAGAGSGAATAAPPEGGLASASASISSAGGRAAARTGSQVAARLMGIRRQVRSRSSHTAGVLGGAGEEAGGLSLCCTRREEGAGAGTKGIGLHTPPQHSLHSTHGMATYRRLTREAQHSSACMACQPQHSTACPSRQSMAHSREKPSPSGAGPHSRGLPGLTTRRDSVSNPAHSCVPKGGNCFNQTVSIVAIAQGQAVQRGQ